MPKKHILKQQVEFYQFYIMNIKKVTSYDATLANLNIKVIMVKTAPSIGFS